MIKQLGTSILLALGLISGAGAQTIEWSAGKVGRNVSQIGTGLDIFLFAAYNGTGIYEGKPHKQLRLLGMSFSDIYIHLVAAKNAPHQDMDSLFRKGKNISIAVTKAGS